MVVLDRPDASILSCNMSDPSRPLRWVHGRQTARTIAMEQRVSIKYLTRRTQRHLFFIDSDHPASHLAH